MRTHDGSHQLPNDTDPRALAVLIARAREMSPAQKFAIAAAMSRAVRGLAEAGVRSRYPHAGEEEVRRRLAVLLLPRDLARAVTGTDPQAEED